MEYKVFDSLPDDARNIRLKVFVEEQHFQNEFDNNENKSKHIVLYENSKPVATARFFEEEPKVYKPGRIAVLKEYRKGGYGKAVLTAAEKEIKALGGKKVHILGQKRVQGFYEKMGYVPYGDIEYDEGVEHINLYKEI